MLWLTTTAWMMWQTLVSALLVRASLVMIDGNPLFPDMTMQWRLAAQTGATLMGASPGFLMACRQEGGSLRESSTCPGCASWPRPADRYCRRATCGCTSSSETTSCST